jgi:hypothetical protein
MGSLPLDIGFAASLLPEYLQPVSLRSAECWLLDIHLLQVTTLDQDGTVVNPDYPVHRCECSFFQVWNH